MEQIDDNRWIKIFLWIIFSLLFYISYFMANNFFVLLSSLLLIVSKLYNIFEFKIIIITIVKASISSVFLIGFVLLALLYFDLFKKIIYKLTNIIKSFPFYLSVVFIIFIPIIFIINQSLHYLNTFMIAYIGQEAFAKYSFHNNIYSILFSIVKIFIVVVLFLFFLIKLSIEYNKNQILKNN